MASSARNGHFSGKKDEVVELLEEALRDVDESIAKRGETDAHVNKALRKRRGKSKVERSQKRSSA